MKRNPILTCLIVGVLILNISFASAGWFSDFFGKITGHVVSGEKSITVSENTRASLSCDSGAINGVSAVYWCPDGSGRKALCNTDGAIGRSSYYFDFTNSNCGGDPCTYVAKKGNLTISCGDVSCNNYRSEGECGVDSSCEWVQGPTFAMVCQERGIVPAPAAKTAGAVNIQGRVLDEEGNPIPGAVVSISSSLMATTDLSGYFMMDISSIYDGRDSYTITVTDLLGNRATINISPGISKTIVIVRTTFRVANADLPEDLSLNPVMKINYNNDPEGCFIYDSSMTRVCGEDPLKVHNGDTLGFDGTGSTYGNVPLGGENMNWYKVEDRFDVPVLEGLIREGKDSIIMRDFFRNLELREGGLGVGDNVNVQLGKDKINIQFKFSSPIGFNSEDSEKQYVVLEVKDPNDEVYNYYIQEISVGCYDKGRSCDASDVVASTFVDDEGTSIRTSITNAEKIELTFRTCESDLDCGVWSCVLGKCSPREFSDLSCKLSSGRGERVEYEGREYTNPFFGNPLFKQLASASPAQESSCVPGDSSKIRVPVCSESGVSFEVRDCPSGTSCLDGRCQKFECIDDYSFRTKDDCWNTDGLCVDGRGCVGFADMGWSEDVLRNVRQLTDSDANVRRNAAFALGEIGSEETVSALIRVLETDSDAYVRVAAAVALGKIGSEETVSALIRVLEEASDAGVRSDAVYALGQIGSEEAVLVLIKALETNNDLTIKLRVPKILVISGAYENVGKLVAEDINELFSEPVDYERAWMNEYAVLINRLHDAESRPEDKVRTEIIQSLNTRSLYYLIAIGGADLYTSTFLKMYQKLCKNPISEDRTCRDASFIDEIDSIDPQGNYKTEFFLRLANFNRQSEIIQGREEFFGEIITDALSNEFDDDLLKNSVLLTNTIKKIFTDQSLHQYKPLVENLLLNRYNDAKSSGDKLRGGIFGYFIKMNYEDFSIRKEEAIRIASSLPEPQRFAVPSDFLSDNKVSAKLYFYDDESWSGITGDWLVQSGFARRVINEKTIVFTKNYNGKILEVTTTTDNSDVKESIDGSEVDIIAHRGHSYHLIADTFPEYLQSSSKKLLYLGSCGSFGSVPQLQKQFPNAYFISDEDTGRGSDNHRILMRLMEKIADGETDWAVIKEDTYKSLSSEPQGIVWPHEESLLLYNFIQRLTGMSIKTLLNQQYGYIPEELFPIPDSCTIQQVPYGETV